MSAKTMQAKIAYFGKIPSRGDFVKAADDIPLITMLDDWLAQTMSLLADDPRWKIHYEAMQPLHFAFVGPLKKKSIAGHLLASEDSSQRRFPFISISTLEIDQPDTFIGNSPLVLSRLWNRLGNLSKEAVNASDANSALQSLSQTVIDLETGAAAYDAAFNDFLQIQTIGGLQRMLAQAGFTGSVRQLFLALGFLLQPVMASGANRLEKSLVLPLPNDPMYRYLIAAFWMHLITPFLLRADFELAIFFSRLESHPAMILGFGGASPRTLHAIFDPQIALEHHIAFDDAEWVEEQVNDDYGVKKLSSYLVQDTLSLQSALESFRTTFIGA